MVRAILIALVVVFFAGHAAAETFESGVSAFKRGDDGAALKIWEALAESGDRDAQFNIGILHAHGSGFDSDRDAALRWLNRAANQGDVVAAYNMGVLLADDATGSPDYESAARWFEVAISAGHVAAMEGLAILLANGRGVERDLARAVRLSSEVEETECFMGETGNNFIPRMSRLVLTH